MSIKNVSSEINCAPQPFNESEFFYKLEKSALPGRVEPLKAMMAHPMFNELDPMDLLDLVYETAFKGHRVCLQALLSNDRSSEFISSIGGIAECIVEKGHLKCLQDLMASERFRPLLKKRSYYLIKTAVEHDRPRCLQLFIAAGWMNEISPKKVGKMARYSAVQGDRACFKMLIGCPQFQEVDPQLMGRIFISTVFSGQEDSLKRVFNSGKFQGISRKDLAIAFEMGKMAENEKALMKAFFKSKWTSLGLSTLGKIAVVFVKNGRCFTYIKACLK